ncbi:MAG: fibronectin type III domain-containing protein [Kiritimatiellae bacterium]|nr:fibronectin type III domain-containing protein [Kiritimatiellia bacterium]
MAHHRGQQRATRHTRLLTLAILLLPAAASALPVWEALDSGVTNGLEEIRFVDATTGWAVGHGGKIIKTTDGGDTWVQQDSGHPDAELISLHFVNSTTGWVVGYDGLLLHTTNAGANWATVDMGTSAHFQSVWFINETTGWLFGNGGTIRKTTNGGDSWFSQTSPVSTALLCGRFVDANVGYISCYNGKVLKTTNGGNNWTTLDFGETGALLSVWVHDANTVWVCGGSGHIYKTTNGGTSWTEQLDAGLICHTLWFLDANHGFCGANGKRIYETTNSGASWPYDSSLDKWIMSIHFPTAYHGYASGGAGVVYRTTIGNPDVPNAPSNLTATAVSTTQIDLTWEDKSSDEDGFKIDRRQSGETAWVRITTTGANETAHNDTGLPAATKYYYKVKAYNANGNSPYSEMADDTTLGAAPVPDPPSNLLANAVSSSRIDLTWSDESDNETGFIIDRRLSVVEPEWTTNFVTVGQDVTAYSDTGLLAESKYYYCVRAWNASGESVTSEVAYATTLAAVVPPDPPTNLTAAAVSWSCIDLAWDDMSDNETGFKIDRRQSVAEPEWTVDIATVGANVSAYTDTGLTGATKYYYRIKACNADGNSPTTDVVYATTLAGMQQEVPKGAAWRYRKGTAEAATPADRWRTLRFDDSGWATGSAPFGYAGTGWPAGTELPDMRTNYLCVFLRRTFETAAPSLVKELHLDIDYDDGFLAWINGQEVARVNMAGSPGEFLDCTTNASGYVDGASTNWTAVLAGGQIPHLELTNVLAVQAFNIAAGSSDLMLDCALSVLPHSLSLTVDADQNAMRDDWEAVHLAGLSDPDDRPDADPDQDGLNNSAEYVAGTTPTNGESFLAVDLAREPAGLIVSFQANAAGGTGYDGLARYYALQAASDLPSGGWLTVPEYDAVLGSNQTVRYTNAAPHPATAYRARCWLESQ